MAPPPPQEKKKENSPKKKVLSEAGLTILCRLLTLDDLDRVNHAPRDKKAVLYKRNEAHQMSMEPA